MTPESKLKKDRSKARKIVKTCSTQKEAMGKLIKEGLAVSKSQARRIYFQVRGCDVRVKGTKREG